MLINKLYNKEYITGVFVVLLQQSEKENNRFYDPAIEDYVTLDKKKALLDCWREYFRVLIPKYIRGKKRSVNNKEIRKQIHLIFGNELANITRIIYGNALFFRIGLATLHDNIKNYK